MTLYARGDLMAVSVPESSGGCGNTHSRPVRDGAPEKLWGLDCPKCEHFLNGQGRTMISMEYERDSKGHIVKNQQGMAINSTMKRVASRDPNWAADPDDLPATAAELAAEQRSQQEHERDREIHERKAHALTTFAALMTLPGANPRKLADTLGLDLSELGFDDEEETPPRPRAPRKPRVPKVASE
jgi:hypothetical protein